MDASLVLAIDGVRHVASTASEVILAVGRGEETSTGDRGGSERIIDRATVAVLNDVETNARAILGCKATDLELAAAQAAGAASRRNVLSVFAFPLLSGLTLGTSAAEDTTTSAAVGITSPGTTAAVAAKQREALVALHTAITNAQLAPITDVIAVYGTDPLPPGFEKVATSVTGVYPADLNASGGAKQCWLAIARFPNAPPITSLVVVMLELGEFIPPGFQPVRHVMTGKPANIRYGVSNSEAYLCFSRAAGAAIIDIGIAFPNGASITPALKNILPGAAESPGMQRIRNQNLNPSYCGFHQLLLQVLRLLVSHARYSRAQLPRWRYFRTKRKAFLTCHFSWERAATRKYLSATFPLHTRCCVAPLACMGVRPGATQ
jgi:hypothetical protein